MNGASLAISHPGGMPAISRRLSVATPPVIVARRPEPGGFAGQRAATLSGSTIPWVSISGGIVARASQPPANVWHPFGMADGECIILSLRPRGSHNENAL